MRQHPTQQILHCLLLGCVLVAALPPQRRRLMAQVLQEQPFLEIEIPLPLLSETEGGQRLAKGGEGPAGGKPVSFKNSCSAHPLHTVLARAQSLWEKQGEASCTPKPGLFLSSSKHNPRFPTKRPPRGRRGGDGGSRGTSLQYDAGRSQPCCYAVPWTRGAAPSKGNIAKLGELEAALTPHRSSPAPACCNLPQREGTQAETTLTHGIRGTPQAGLPPVCLVPLDFGAGILSACTD